MSVNPSWIEETASAFWQLAGGEPAGFPRDPERAILHALPIGIVSSLDMTALVAGNAPKKSLA